MRYYIAYKFLDTDKEVLKQNLSIICDQLEKNGHTTFVFFRDIQNRWAKSMTNEEILEQAFSEIKKSDGLFALVESEEKSEWMLLEIGYAKAQGKKLILAIKPWINLRFVRALADQIIEFQTIEHIKF